MPIPNEALATLPEGRRALRIDEFVAAYRISRSTVYKMAAAGKLKISKIGGRSPFAWKTLKNC